MKILYLENWSSYEPSTEVCPFCHSVLSVRWRNYVKDNPENRILLRTCGNDVLDQVVGQQSHYFCQHCRLYNHYQKID